mmetsp:Transcript_35623/g.106306  ORF Transcript_35623/g.106306 Transcript_35623/m.106306 type:complete len:94 (-) Transcript_35623:2414-2695(-)
MINDQIFLPSYRPNGLLFFGLGMFGDLACSGSLLFSPAPLLGESPLFERGDDGGGAPLHPPNTGDLLLPLSRAHVGQPSLSKGASGESGLSLE